MLYYIWKITFFYNKIYSRLYYLHITSYRTCLVYKREDAYGLSIILVREIPIGILETDQGKDLPSRVSACRPPGFVGYIT